MDEFDLPLDQVEAILATPAGAEALWKSGRRPATVIRCPRRHALARVYEFPPQSYLVLGAVEQSGRFAGGTWDTALPARAIRLDNLMWRERFEVARCHCGSWWVGTSTAFRLYTQGEATVVLDESQALVAGGDIQSLGDEVSAYIQWAQLARHNGDLSPDAIDAYNELLDMADSLHTVASREEVDAIAARAKEIAVAYIDWDHARETWMDR